MDDLLYLRIIYCTIIFVFSFITSLVIQLNRFANDKNNDSAKYSLVYISDALISSLSGFLFGLTTIVFTPENPIVWIVAGILGGFLGQKLIPIMLRIFLSIFKNVISSDEIQKIVSAVEHKTETGEEEVGKSTESNEKVNTGN